MTKKSVHSVLAFFISCFYFAGSLTAQQSVFSSEEDLKKQAEKLFDEEEFAKAYPLFSQLLSLYPKDPQYNYKFGTCLLYASKDKEKAIPYIEYGAKRQKQGVDKEVFFYLGKAYHLNYRFTDAIRLYNVYKTQASSKQQEKYNVSRQVEMCESGTRLLKTVTDLSVLEKKEVPSAEFFRSYNLTEFNAKLIVKPDDLKSSADKKKKDESIMYLAPDRNEIYYSSYGEDGKTGKDIYMVKRTSSGDLTKPVRLPDVINTKYDEDYVFLHPNGKSLYFCSKGHNSMGGYDIFKSEWNAGTQSWGKPVNMDFPINTPDDDILFISDSEDKSAYFSSGRESAEGNLTVYKIKLERKPLDLAVISGTLKKETGDKMPKAVITVTKIMKDEVVGVFNTNAADGSYTLDLPNGGKFMFSVESSGFKKSSELVVIPNQSEIVPLKQEILLVNEGGTDKIIIKNEFDAQVDSTDRAMAIQYIKAKASLEVSPPEQEITSQVVDENPKNETKTETKTNASISSQDIIGIAYDDAKETQKDANELRKNAEDAEKLSNQKNQQSLQKNKEASDLMKEAETITNQDQKLAKIDSASKFRKEADALSKEAAISLTISNQSDEQAKAKQQQADAQLKYAKDLDAAIKSGAGEQKMNNLLAQKEALDKKSEELNAAANFSADMNKKAEEKQQEAAKAMAKYIDVQQDIEDLQNEAKRQRSEADKTKNDGVKQNLISQAEEMEKEAETKKKDADTYSTQAKQLQASADSLKNNASLASSVITQIQSASTAETASTASVTPSNTTITSTAVTETKTEQPETTAVQVLVIKSPYVDVFVNQMHEAEKITKELDREQSFAVIYQSWTDSLDNQIASLQKQLDGTSIEQNKKQIQNKIYELQSSVEDKRQRAADSRSKVDNLKMQEALAIASTVTPETTAVSTNTVTPVNTQTVSAVQEISPENLQGTDNINTYYENKLKENAAEKNEYSKKSKEQELYNDWASSLYDESQRLRKDGKGGRADDAEKASKEKQAIAMQTADQVTTIKAEHPDWVEAAKTKEQETASTQTSSETKTEVQPVNTSTVSAVSPETTAVSTVTPVNTQTVSSTETASTETKTESSNPPVNSSSLPTVPPESVKNKDEYTHYASLRNEADWAKKNADRQNQQANDLQKIADEQLKESEKLSLQSESTADPNQRQVLKSQSENLEKRSLRNQAKADSVKVLAKNSDGEANSKRTESELYLQGLDKTAYEEIAEATGYKPSTTETAAANTNTVSTTNPAVTETAKTTTVTASETASTNTVSTTNPSATETVKTNTATSSETAATNTVSTTNPSLTQTAATNTLTASTETKTETVTQPRTSTTVYANTNPPVNTAGSSEIRKYYEDLFDRVDLAGADYSSSKPIPVDPPMPEGLIFKVQIGAFRNPIPQNLFKGIKPITAETTPQGLKRYTAGLFQKFMAANAAKEQVRSLGYRDAFVTAFFNGKRISMNEALDKAKQAGETINAAALASAGTQTSSSSVSVSETGTNTANAADVKSVTGLFYTIQIGVYSKQVTAAQLYNISPLNSERTDNGLIRYTTGRFGSETTASRAKNSIAGKGISDAFIVAYYNGKRISLSQAKSIIDSQGEGVISKDKQEYSFVPSDTTASESSAQNLTIASNKGISFRVQVGAYREQVPIEDANKLLKVSNKGIKTFTDENGLMVYTVGEFLEYETANNVKTQMINEGFSGAFVIAFKEGKKMSAQEALDMLKNR